MTADAGGSPSRFLVIIAFVGGYPVSDFSGFPVGSRRDEDIALDLMKFIAGTTGYGKTTGVGAGFQSGAANKAEDYAKHLLDLYGQCLVSVKDKK